MHRGRTVLAMDCALAGAETHRGRPLNSVVSRLLKNDCEVGGLLDFGVIRPFRVENNRL